MILLYNATQLNLAGCREQLCSTAETLDLVAKLVTVLEFCGELDPVAREFSQSLSAYHASVQEACQHEIRTGASDSALGGPFPLPQPSDYLFVKAPGSAQLHNSSQNLFEQLCNPYSSVSASTTQQEHDASQSRSSRIHMSASDSQRTPCDRPGTKVPGGNFARTPITAGISNLEDGYFVGSNEPTWWITKRSAAVYSNGARTLEIL